MNFIRLNPGKKMKNIAEKLNISENVAEKRIGKLKANGKIIFIGAPKVGGYFIVEEK